MDDTADTLILPTDAAGRRLRHDGWTPERQRLFLEAIAAGHTVGDACYKVGLSITSAYSLRDRATGQAFALGWAAANQRARGPLADKLLARAVHGQTEWRTLPNGERAERFRYDNGLATRMLARMDAQADAAGPAEQAAARLVAGEFEAFLQLIGQGAGAAQAGLFLAARADAPEDLEPVRLLARADRFARTGAALAGEVDVGDLDVGQRDGWSAEQWQRADAAGLLRAAPVAPSPEPQHVQLVPREPEPVWWSHEHQQYRTHFPPPPDHDGDDEHEFGHEDYERSLTPAELDAFEPLHRTTEAGQAAAAAARDAWFAARAVENGVAYEVPAPGEHGGDDEDGDWEDGDWEDEDREDEDWEDEKDGEDEEEGGSAPDGAAERRPAGGALPTVIPAQAGTQLLRFGIPPAAGSDQSAGDRSPPARE